MPSVFRNSLAWLLLAANAPAWAQTSAPSLPEQTTLTYDEDWSVLADTVPHGQPWNERIKYRPLDASGDTWIGSGLELRLRVEDYENNLWGDAPDQTARYVRAIPYLDLHAGRARVFVQPILAVASGVRPAAGPVDETGLDLLQGFVEITLGGGSDDALHGTIRSGRQMVILGSERLVGTRYGVNLPRSFDGLRLDLTQHGGSLSILMLRPVAPGKESLDDKSSDHELLWGAHAALGGVNLYYLGYRNQRSMLASGRDQRHSFGTRVHGSHRNWSWNVEAVAQAGTLGDQHIRAWTLASEFGRSFTVRRIPLKAQVRFDIASGDGDPNDNRSGTFNALFPKGKYFGELSPIGPYNLVNFNPRLSATLSDRVTASLSANGYWRQSAHDGVYDITGRALRSSRDSRALHVGTQAEAILEWQATSEIDLLFSASLFAPGAFLRETGRSQMMAMLAAETTFRF